MMESFKKIKSSMILKVGREHKGPKLYEVFINDYLSLILTNLTKMSNSQNVLFVLFMLLRHIYLFQVYLSAYRTIGSLVLSCF